MNENVVRMPDNGTRFPWAICGWIFFGVLAGGFLVFFLYAEQSENSAFADRGLVAPNDSAEHASQAFWGSLGLATFTGPGVAFLVMRTRKGNQTSDSMHARVMEELAGYDASLSYLPPALASPAAYRQQARNPDGRFLNKRFVALMVSQTGRELAIVEHVPNPYSTTLLRIPFSQVISVQLATDAQAYGSRTISETLVLGQAAPTRSVISATNARIEIRVDNIATPVHVVPIGSTSEATVMNSRLQLLLRPRA